MTSLYMWIRCDPQESVNSIRFVCPADIENLVAEVVKHITK